MKKIPKGGLGGRGQSYEPTNKAIVILRLIDPKMFSMRTLGVLFSLAAMTVSEKFHRDKEKYGKELSTVLKDMGLDKRKGK